MDQGEEGQRAGVQSGPGEEVGERENYLVGEHYIGGKLNAVWTSERPGVTGPSCDGLCVDSADIGVPGYGVAYPHPGCPLHAPGERCGCGQPDRCNSYTHDPVWLAANPIRNGSEG